jgi:hypothetical protein
MTDAEKERIFDKLCRSGNFTIQELQVLKVNLFGRIEK